MDVSPHRHSAGEDRISLDLLSAEFEPVGTGGESRAPSSEDEPRELWQASRGRGCILTKGALPPQVGGRDR